MRDLPLFRPNFRTAILPMRALRQWTGTGGWIPALKSPQPRSTDLRAPAMRLSPRSRTLVVGTVAVAAAGSAAMLFKKTLTPRVVANPSEWNRDLLALCPYLTTPYDLPAILNNGHVETIFAALFRRRPHILYSRELLHMPDGGVVALDSETLPEGERLPPDAPLLILLPGLTGGSEDSYVQHAVVHARAAGIRAMVFNSRGTSDSPVATAQFYSASFTEDLRCVVRHVAAGAAPGVPIFAAGWSLGANILTRYLGEEGGATPLAAAVAMCNPFDLPRADANFARGFCRFYDWNLANSLRRIYARHHPKFVAAAGEKPFDPELALRARSVREFDVAVTVPSFGWPDADTYYASSSSKDVVDRVQIPLLVIQAEDDPIAPEAGIPYEALEANPTCTLVVTPTGGHLGWCSGGDGVTGAPWTDRAVVDYLKAVMALQGARERAAPVLEAAGVYTEGRTTHQAP